MRIEKLKVKMLTENIDKLHAVANALLEREKLSGEEFEKVYNGISLTESEKTEENVDVTDETENAVPSENDEIKTDSE